PRSCAGKMDLSNPDSRATLITEIERQLDRALADIENTAQFSREFLQTLKWDDVMAEVMDASKQNLISLGYLKAHNTFTEDVVTSYGKNLEREMHAFITYLNQFQQSQAKKPLAKTFWDGHLIWASLLGTEEALHEQMLAVDPS